MSHQNNSNEYTQLRYLCTIIIFFFSIVKLFLSPESIFTNHSSERSLSYSPDFSTLASLGCNSTSDWQSHMV